MLIARPPACSGVYQRRAGRDAGGRHELLRRCLSRRLPIAGSAAPACSCATNESRSALLAIQHYARRICTLTSLFTLCPLSRAYLEPAVLRTLRSSAACSLLPCPVSTASATCHLPPAQSSSLPLSLPVILISDGGTPHIFTWRPVCRSAWKMCASNCHATVRSPPGSGQVSRAGVRAVSHLLLCSAACKRDRSTGGTLTGRAAGARAVRLQPQLISSSAGCSAIWLLLAVLPGALSALATAAATACVHALCLPLLTLQRSSPHELSRATATSACAADRRCRSCATSACAAAEASCASSCRRRRSSSKLSRRRCREATCCWWSTTCRHKGQTEAGQGKHAMRRRYRGTHADPAYSRLGHSLQASFSHGVDNPPCLPPCRPPV